MPRKTRQEFMQKAQGPSPAGADGAEARRDEEWRQGVLAVLEAVQNRAKEEDWAARVGDDDDDSTCIVLIRSESREGGKG